MAKDSKSTPPKDLDLGDVSQVIRVFGGLRPLAAAIGVPASTVQGWKERRSIPAGRHDEIRTAYAKRAQTSDVPVDHAIEAAAEIRDNAPPQANEQTRNYQPPRSQATPSAVGTVNAGGSNLILSLILFVLMILVAVIVYLVFISQAGRGNDLVLALQSQLDQISENQNTANEAVEQGLVSLATAGEQTNSSLNQLQIDFTQIKDLDQSLAATSENLLAGLASQLEDAVLDVSSQLRTQAQDLTGSSQQQADTAVELARSQTALFEALSQDLLTKMDTIAANMDVSVTEQVARLQEQVEIAQTDALGQRRQAEDMAARAEAAEAALARSNQWDVGVSARDLVALAQLRLALATNQELEAGLAALASVAGTDEDLLSAWQTLSTLSGTEYLASGLPSSSALVEELDRLIEADRDEIRSGTFGFARIPSAENLNTNQGRLAAGRVALASGDFGRAAEYLAALDGSVAEQSGDLTTDLDAHVLVASASAALDRWFAAQALQD